MELSKAHVFDAPIQRVWEMLLDEASHVAKYEHMGHTNIVVIEFEATSSSIHTMISRDVTVDLPSIAKRLYRPTNTIVSTDDWTANDDGTFASTFAARTSAAPVELRGTALLEPLSGDRTRYTVHADLRLKIPVIGARLAPLAGPNFDHLMADDFASADRWLAAH